MFGVSDSTLYPDEVIGGPGFDQNMSWLGALEGDIMSWLGTPEKSWLGARRRAQTRSMFLLLVSCVFFFGGGLLVTDSVHETLEIWRTFRKPSPNRVGPCSALSKNAFSAERRALSTATFKTAIIPQQTHFKWIPWQRQQCFSTRVLVETNFEVSNAFWSLENCVD